MSSLSATLAQSGQFAEAAIAAAFGTAVGAEASNGMGHSRSCGPEMMPSLPWGDSGVLPSVATAATPFDWIDESLFPLPAMGSPEPGVASDQAGSDRPASDSSARPASDNSAADGLAPVESFGSEPDLALPDLPFPDLTLPDIATSDITASDSRDLSLLPGDSLTSGRDSPNLQTRQPLASYQGELSELDDYNPQRFATFKDDYFFSVGLDGFGIGESGREGSAEAVDDLGGGNQATSRPANRQARRQIIAQATAEGSAVEFSLSASDFDPYLQILPVNRDEILAFDDDSGPGRNSQLSLQVKPGDRFILRVTSYAPEAIGDYRLSLFSNGAISVIPQEGEPEAEDDPANPLPALIDGNVQPDSEQFQRKSGYGLVDAAAAVAAALNLAEPERDQPFAAVPDLGRLDQPLDLLQVPEVWAQGFTGQGVTVAVVDSGLDSRHPELQGRLWVNADEIPGDGIDNDQNGYIDDVNGWNFGRDQFNNQIAPGTASPFQGHGTHVAGIIAGARDNLGNSGVAYDAQIMPLRLGDTNNAGVFLNPGDLAAAVRYAVDNGADVVNLSLGWSDSPALRSALQYAAQNNVVVVGASGNSGLSTPVSPARYAVNWGLSVGAVTSGGKLAAFSNGAGYNTSIRHVMAPGNRIVSAEPGGGYQPRSGTSMAAPYVSGVVALMLSANPDLTQGQVRDILAATATAIA